MGYEEKATDGHRKRPIPIDNKLEELFLTLLRDHPYCNVGEVCRTIGVRRRSMYSHRDVNPEFAADWDEITAAYKDRLEAEADRRARDGVEKNVYFRGRVVGTQIEYSDDLLKFRLRKMDPAYHSPVANNIINVHLTREQIENMSDDELDSNIDALTA